MATSQMCIIEITKYRATRSLLPMFEFPSPDTLEETSESPHLFSYTTSRILSPINDPDGAKRRGLETSRCAGIFISECQPLPGRADERVFFTIHGHPKERSGYNEGDTNDSWIPLGFEEINTDCVLNHLGASNKLPCRPHEEPAPSWLKLFIGTTHLSLDTVGTCRVLLGPPEILWGLVALNIGDDIDNLGEYIRPRGSGLSLSWQAGNEPDRTPARVLAVKIYYDREMPRTKLEFF